MKYGYKEVCLEKILDKHHGDQFEFWIPIEECEERFYRYEKNKKHTSYIKRVDAGGPYHQMKIIFGMSDMFPLTVVPGQDILIVIGE